MPNLPDIKNYPCSLLIDRSVRHPELEKRLVGEIADSGPVGLGYGYEYTPDMAAQLLAMPLPANVRFLSTEGEGFYYDKVRRVRMLRSSFGYRHSSRRLWYPQGFEPTCLPMSFATASVELGQSVNSVFFASLLNEANGVNDGEEGMRMKHLRNLTGQRSDGVMPGHMVYRLSGIVDYANYLTRAIDDGGVVLESVEPSAYMGLRRKSPLGHAIALLGYERSRLGFDVQVADSNLGIMFLPIEFLYSVRRESMFALYSRTPSAQRLEPSLRAVS